MWGRAALVLAPILLASCGELIDADSYDTAPQGRRYRDPADILPAACRPCIEQNCANQLAACASDPECDGASRCVFGKLDPATFHDCTNLHPTAGAFGTPLGTCAAAACMPDCATDVLWACVGNYVWPAPQGDSAVVRYQVLDFVSLKPVVGLSVKACDRRDPDCHGSFDSGFTDGSGHIELEVPMLEKSTYGIGESGFDGFLLVEGEGFPPTYRYQSRPIIGPSDSSFSLATLATIAASAQTVHAPLDPERGILIIEAWNCVETRAAGVRFEVDTADEQSTGFYFAGGLPAKLEATTSAGMGGYINLRPGLTTVRVVDTATNREVARSSAHVHAGGLTVLGMLPET